MTRTYQIEGAFSDPMLWLYADTDQLVAANDDWYGLQSNIDRLLAPGTYRLRAGFCCGDPNATRYGQMYELATSASPITHNVDQSTTTTVAESTTTSVPESTTTLLPETTSSSTTLPESTTIQATTTTVQPTTTTVEPSTSLQETTTTEEATSTSQVVTTTSEPTMTELATTTVQPTTTKPRAATTEPVPLRPLATTPPSTGVQTTQTTELPTTTTTEVEKPTGEPVAYSPEPITDPAQLPANVSDLPPAEKAALVTKLNSAPAEVKRAFEATVNVFDGSFDNYVPADQTVPVSTRRTLIAVSAGLVTLSATAPNRKNKR